MTNDIDAKDFGTHFDDNGMIYPENAFDSVFVNKSYLKKENFSYRSFRSLFVRLRASAWLAAGTHVHARIFCVSRPNSARTSSHVTHNSDFASNRQRQGYLSAIGKQ